MLLNICRSDFSMKGLSDGVTPLLKSDLLWVGIHCCYYCIIIIIVIIIISVSIIFDDIITVLKCYYYGYHGFEPSYSAHLTDWVGCCS